MFEFYAREMTRRVCVSLQPQLLDLPLERGEVARGHGGQQVGLGKVEYLTIFNALV